MLLCKLQQLLHRAVLWSWSVVVVVVVEYCCCIPYQLALILVLTFAPCTLTERDWRRSPTSASIRSLFHGNGVMAFKTAIIEDDNRTKTAINGAFSRKLLRTMLTRAQLTTQRQCETLLLRESRFQSRFQSRPPYKYPAYSALLILEQYKCQYNYTSFVSILFT